MQGRLAQGVAQKVGIGVEELLIQQIDHAARRRRRLAPGQMGGQRLRQQHGRRRVHLHVRAQQRGGKRGGVVKLEQSGAVHHGVHPPEMRRHARHQGARGGLIGQIGLKHRAAAFGCRGLRLGLRAMTVNGHPPARAGQMQGNGAAQTAARAGDENNGLINGWIHWADCAGRAAAPAAA